MLNRFLAMAVAIGALGSASWAFAQEATEMYVPIGQSPGVSGKTTVIGTVQALNAAARTLTVAGPSGLQTFAITAKTRIWLDRSAAKQSNQSGSLPDLQQGRRVEVKPQSAAAKAGADWIKVQVPGG
jgi:ABC-type sugar transport system substrate-binding protein